MTDRVLCLLESFASNYSESIDGVTDWCESQVCTAKMNLSEEVDLEDYVSRPDKISAAEVGSVWITSSISLSITCLADDMFCNYVLSCFLILF